MGKVVIIGGGPAGMLAAIGVAENGHEAHIYEKNEKLGKKLFITGKGRCNLTNASDMETILQNIVTNRKFMYSALYTYTNEQIVGLIESYGVPTKVERGNRVFPVSDKSSDVIKALSLALDANGVQVHLKSKVKDLIVQAGEAKGIVLDNGNCVYADAVIVASGGLSYPSTGSDGDGFAFARKQGIEVTQMRPALVPLTIKEDICKDLMGLSLKNVCVTILDGKKQLYQNFGEMIFTHFGVSGPLILSASSIVAKKVREKELTMYLDLKPALDEEQLDKRLLREFEQFANKQFKNSLDSLLPKKLIPVIIELSGIHPEQKVNEITRGQRENLRRVLKQFPLTVTGTRGYHEAIITQGGISVKEINAGTMESKKVKSLFFAGEVLDVDAMTGGYNLQIAWSTGYLAGIHAGNI
ncbi:MAG: NAD(P)/FAD-dependent oxidoreductase [Lachnospiraceae bacterium]|nr:NAD(P)/FAD-dependent oxidoreductase [Lachnospiraceae bacterium]